MKPKRLFEIKIFYSNQTTAENLIDLIREKFPKFIFYSELDNQSFV